MLYQKQLFGNEKGMIKTMDKMDFWVFFEYMARHSGSTNTHIFGNIISLSPGI